MKKFILIGFLVLMFSIGLVSAADLSNSGGGDWKYYREITIKENSGKTLTDYQVLIELNSANFDFSKAKSDGSDIRFVDSDGNELSYWIEEWSAGKAKVWVKVPRIPANGEAKIKMYYGNPSAVTVSNGDKTFEFFDDFEDGMIGDKWIPKSGTWTEVKGYIRVDSSGKGRNVLMSNYIITDGIIETRVMPRQSNQRDIGFYARSDGEVRQNTYFFGLGVYDYKIAIAKDVNAKASALAGVGSYTDNAIDEWYVITATLYKDNLKLIHEDGTEVFTVDRTYPSGYLALYLWDGKETVVDAGRWDWIFVHKYVSSEPTPAISAEQPVITTPLKLTKTVSPHSIKQGQETTVSVTVENVGKTTIKDIEVKDTLSDDFEFVTGKTSAKYDEIKPGESRTFQYKIKSREAGKFNLPKATALYADAQGNYHEIESGIPQVEVIASLVEETPTSAVTTPPAAATGETKEETPGFEALFAITGLMTVLYVMRRFGR